MMSSRARRMAVHHQRHQAGFELNLIPLIDILSVMVSFFAGVLDGSGGHPEQQGHRDPAVDFRDGPEPLGRGHDHQDRPVRAG